MPRNKDKPTLKGNAMLAFAVVVMFVFVIGFYLVQAYNYGKLLRLNVIYDMIEHCESLNGSVMISYDPVGYKHMECYHDGGFYDK